MLIKTVRQLHVAEWCKRNSVTKEPLHKAVLYCSLLSILIFSFLLRLYLIEKTPVTWNSASTGLQAFNDEASHVNYVRYIMLHRSMPVQTANIMGPDAFIRNEFEYYQPPLSYVITAILAEITSVDPHSESLIRFCRLVSCAAGMAGISLFFFVLVGFLPLKSATWCVLLYAFLPVHWRHTSSFSNDSFLWIFPILLLPMLHSRQSCKSPGRVRNLCLEGFVIGCGLLTKSSMLTLVISYGIFGVINRRDRKNWFIPPMIGLALAGPYYLRNYLLYNELIGLSVSCGRDITEGVAFAEKLLILSRGMLSSFVFPFDTLLLPKPWKIPIYLIWASVFGFCVVIIVKHLIRNVGEKAFTFYEISTIIVVVSLVSLIRYNMHSIQTEFRHLFHVMPFALWIAGDAFSGARFRWISVVTGLGIILPLIQVILRT